MALGLLTVWTLARVLDDPSGMRLVAWAAAAAGCLWTHYYAGFLVPAEACLLFVRQPAVRRRIVAVCAGFAVAAAPLVRLLADQRDSRSGYIEHLPVRARLEQTVRQFGMGMNVPAAWLEGAGLAVLAAGLVAGLVLSARERQGGLAILAALAAFTVVVPAAMLVLGIDEHSFMRNVLVAWPLMAAVAAAGLLLFRGAPARPLPGAHARGSDLGAGRLARRQAGLGGRRRCDRAPRR